MKEHRQSALQVDPSAILVDVVAKTPEEVIHQLANRLLALGAVASSYYNAVKQREVNMPTGLPLAEDFAVAVPHTDPEHVLKPTIALAVLRHPVPFQSMEDPNESLPVRLVFMLALKDKNEQIEMLRQVASMLQDEPRLRCLAGAKSVNQVLEILGQETVF